MSSLNDNAGNVSSMRKNVKLIVYVVCFVIVCIGAYILIHAVKGNSIEAGIWTGMGALLAGAGTIFGSILYMQQKQKASELKSEDAKKKLEVVKKLEDLPKDIG